VRRTAVVVLGMVLAYLAGVVTIPIALRVSSMRTAVGGRELRWTPEGGWESRDVPGPAPLSPPSTARLAGVVGAPQALPIASPAAP